MASVSANESFASCSDQPLTQEEEETLKQILSIKDSLKQSLTNMESIQRTIENSFKNVENEKKTKFDLEKEIAELETNFKIENRERDLIGNQLVLIGKMSKEIGEASVFCEETLKSITEGVETVTGLLAEQNNKNAEEISQLILCYKELECHEIEISNDVSKQREQNNAVLLNMEKEILNLKDNEEFRKKELEHTEALLKEFLEKNQSLSQQVFVLEKQYLDIKNQCEEKEILQTELLGKIRDDNEQFQVARDEATNKLLDIKDKILKKESEVSTLEKALQNQIIYKEELLEKIKLQEGFVTALKIERNDFERAKNDKKSEFESAECELRTNIKTSVDEITSLEEIYTKEKQDVEELQNNIRNWANKHENLFKSNQHLESEIDNLRKDKIDSLKNIDNMKQQILIISNEHQQLTEEVNESTLALSVWEKNQIERKIKKEMELANYNIQIEKIINQEQELKKSIIQDMNTLKLESDIKTFQQKKIFEEQLKILQTEKESIEKEVNERSIIETAQALELQQITEHSKSLKDKIEHTKTFNQYLVTMNKFDSIDCSAFSTSNKSQTASRSITPLKRQRLFDELSGSSVGGIVITAEEIQKHQEQKKLRQKLREQRKAKQASRKKCLMEEKN